MMLTKYINTHPLIAAVLWGLLGFSAGFLNGLLGAAGGVLLLVLLLLMPPFPASKNTPSVPPPQGKSVFVTGLWVMIPATLISALLYFAKGMSGALSLAAIIALPAAAGGLVGALLLRKLPRTVLRKIFALLVLFAGVRMVLS